MEKNIKKIDWSLLSENINALISTQNLPTKNLRTKNLPTKNLPTKNLPTKNLPTNNLRIKYLILLIYD